MFRGEFDKKSVYNIDVNWEEHLEFFSIKVPDGPLTSQLQHLKEGDEILISKKEEFIKRQMMGADFVLINKKDLAKPGQVESIEGWFKKEFPDKKVMIISAKTGENLDSVYEMMK